VSGLTGGWMDIR